MRSAIGPRSEETARLASRFPRLGTLRCDGISRSLLEAGLEWLAVEADRLRLDALIVVPSLAFADCLASVLPLMALDALVGGNVVRMNHGSLCLVTPSEILRSTRRHAVMLCLGLNHAEREMADRMNPAAQCVVAVTGAFGRI
jgi:hypothetical protein